MELYTCNIDGSDLLIAEGPHLKSPGADIGEPVEVSDVGMVARRGEDVLASVPDLITVVDSDTGEPTTTTVWM